MPEEPKLIERFFIPFSLFGLLLFGVYYAKNPVDNQSGRLRISYLNVGQGDSTLIKTPHNRYYLVDGGPDKSVITELGEELPPTKREIEGIILSHPHADHVAGFNYVLDRYKVKKVYLTGVEYKVPEYQAFVDKIKSLNIETVQIYQGYSFSDDEVNMSFYWPHKDEANAPNDLNDTSAVMNVNYKDNNFLFLGDLSTKTQERMMGEVTLPGANILKVSHHGSKTGTATQLLEAIKPEYAVILVGKNSYGHPSPTVLEKLSAQVVLRTDQVGRIKFESDGNQLILLK